MVKKSESCGGVEIDECTVQRLLFADDLVLLDSTQKVSSMLFTGVLMHARLPKYKSVLSKQKPCACPDNQSSAPSKLMEYH